MATATAENAPRAFFRRGFKALRANPPKKNFAKAASI
jgi:hypothetical protein